MGSSLMGFVFHSFNLLLARTAAKNVEMPLLITSMGSRRTGNGHWGILSQVGLTDRALHLSGGWRKRVAGSRTLANQ